MDDENRKANEERPEERVQAVFSIDGLSFLIDRIVVIGWVVTSPLWLVGYARSMLWVSYFLAMLTALDVILHFRVHKSVVAWALLLTVGLAGYFQTEKWKVAYEQSQQESQRQARETETHGWLEPANDPTPKNACSDTVIPSNGLLVILGTSAAWSVYGNSFPIIHGTCFQLEVKRERDMIALTVSVRGNDGNIALQITDNEFHLMPREISYPERPDKSTLIVNDPRGYELFYARYLNPRTLEIRTRVFCEDSTAFEIGQNGIVLKGRSTYSHSCAAGPLVGFTL